MNYNMDAINEHRLYIADLRAQLDAANAYIARAEDTATHAVEAWRKATAAHDVIIGQWKTEERMWRDADKKQLTEIAALRDEVVEARRHNARQLNEIELMKAKIAELEAAQRWISVDERLPEPFVDVFVIDSDGYWSRGWLSKLGAWYVGLHPIPVTHWMPLPPPPVTDVTP